MAEEVKITVAVQKENGAVAEEVRVTAAVAVAAAAEANGGIALRKEAMLVDVLPETMVKEVVLPADPVIHHAEALQQWILKK